MFRLQLFIAVVLLLVAAPIVAGGREFEAELTGDQEVPVPVVTDTTGTASFKVNGAMTRMRFKLEIDDGVNILAIAGAHIHCGPVGQNGPVAAFLAGAVPPSGFNGGVKVQATLTDASLIPTACGSTIAELVDSFFAGQAYVNVHSAANPGGEVRGQIEPDDDDDSDSD